MSNTYEIIEKKGLKVISLKPICETGLAEAFCTVRDNPFGNSKGTCGPFSCNIYKPYGLEDGIKDFKLLCDSIGVDHKRVVTNRLTAFTNIVRKIDDSSLKNYDILDEKAAPRADGLITDRKGIVLMNYQADCQIIVFLDPGTVGSSVYRQHDPVVGSIHVSWKGSLNGIIDNEVKAFVDDYGTDINNLVAVLLPSISQEFYSISPYRVAEFESAGFSCFIDKDSYNEPHVDLTGINHSILLCLGLNDKNIHLMNDLCTYRDEKLFHSYRRGPINEHGVHLNGMNACFIRLL